MDFARVPFTAEETLLSRMAALGRRLVDLHLLDSSEWDPPACRFEGVGERDVGRGHKAGLRYAPAEERVHINPTQHFGPVPRQVWEYQIGGYQVCQKWLKDRQGSRLTVDQIRAYIHIVTALKATITIQEELDALYPLVEGNTI